MNKKIKILFGLILTTFVFSIITTSAFAIIKKNKVLPQKSTTTIILGTVSSINGNNILLYIKQGTSAKTKNQLPVIATTTHVVDATNASVLINNATSSISEIAVGDTLFVQGVADGNKKIIANIIRDIATINSKVKVISNNNQKQNSTSTLANNSGSQPVIIGTVTSINNSTIIIKDRNSTSFSIDATSAKILKKNGEILVSNIALGDYLMVQGKISSSSAVATVILDRGIIATTSASKSTTNIFNKIGNFIKGLF